MSALVEMREAIVETLAEAFEASGVNVRSHAGRMDSKEELARVALASPCVLIACLGVPSETLQGGQPRARSRWGAFVITRGAVDEKRDAAALAIAEVLLARIPGNKWGIGDAGVPQGIRGDNLYSGKIDSQGVAMWAIGWSQDIDLSAEVDISTLEPFETLNSKIDMAEADDTIDAEDSIELEQS